MPRAHSRFREIAAASLKVGLSTVAGLVGWIVGGKILALELGAAGVGIFGLLRQLLQSLTTLTTLSGGTALVQGIASRSGDAQRRYTRSVGLVLVSTTGAVCFVLVVGAPRLGPLLLPHPQSESLLRWTGLALFGTTVQAFLIGVLNAHKDVRALVRAQLLAPLSVLLLAYPVASLVKSGHASGMVLILAAPSAAVAAFAWHHARRAGWVRLAGGGWIDRADARAFLETSLVLLSSGLLVTGTQYLQNRMVVSYLGLAESGQFWVAWTVSMTYVTVLLNSYGTYYMPALSALVEPAGRLALIRDYLRLALVAMPLLVSSVILVKPWIVLGMFNASLLPALKVMRWMLVGDLLKGVAWVLAFPMLAFNEMRMFFWTEVAFNVGLAGLSIAWLASSGGIEGLGIAFLALYLVYLLLMWRYLSRAHGFRLQATEAKVFAAGLLLVAAVSAITWNASSVEPAAIGVFVGFGGAFVLFVARALRSTRAMP